MPLWCDEGPYLSADMASGATSLTVAGADDVDWRSEGVLWSDNGGQDVRPTTEGVQFSNISAGVFTLAAPVAGAFKSGTQLLPLMRGYQIGEYTEECLSPEVSKLDVTFVEDLSRVANPSIGGLPSALTYLGMPVLPLIAEWSTAPKFGVGKGTHLAASGFNAQALVSLRTYPRQSISHNIGLDGRQDRALLWQFFHDRRGRWDRFWLPALKDELSLSANAGANDTTLQLANYADFVSRYQLGGDLRRAIVITDGFNFWIRQVANLSGGTNRITIDAPIGTQALRHSSTQVGLLTLVQFAADDIEIECQAPVVATAALSFTELEHEYAEVITSGTTNGVRNGMELQTA